MLTCEYKEVEDEMVWTWIKREVGLSCGMFPARSCLPTGGS